MAENRMKSRGLGRGLSALMADVNDAPAVNQADTGARRPDMMVPIEKIVPNPDQPRRRFDPEHLEDLS
ncbi:MAG: chromosome partitioning protein ParB, partial [Cognatishimia sp.]|nr:chromosome partitioning protein ParB [Cognatishimia sp.]